MKKLVIVLLVAFALAACSTFEPQWQAALKQPATGVTGAWIGRWQSEHNGHNDVLRCVVSSKTNGQYETHFHAKYTTCCFPVSFAYKLDMTVREANGTHQFSGEADLGYLAGGVYRYEGNGTAQQLLFHYRCPSDHGTFRLQRPQ